MQPSTVTVAGSFQHRDGSPVQGVVRFTPSRLWVITGGIAWACLAPVVWLDADGKFSVQVTPTDIDAIMWRYYVETPAGGWEVSVPQSEAGYSLRGLIDEHRSGPRTSHG